MIYNIFNKLKIMSKFNNMNERVDFENQKYFKTCMIGSIFGLMANFLFLIIFLLIKAKYLVFYNIFSLALLLSLTYLLYKRPNNMKCYFIVQGLEFLRLFFINLYVCFF